uniref:FAM50A/XAP5 C-terminal domain-containing protein n=1 Tax=Ditylum brightwellii TaxID=49249 RepID=A0A6U3VLY5_9STRA|mmetsp:Transcript_20585/g.27083  ORF Transcript_20585/g.27083 Transcript_20585/m.27083 type:complete len:396 (-) Transcript_20585:237-1424(-)
MGDFVANFHRPESGIHTIEGNVAGSRAAALTKKREKDARAFEEKKQQIKHESERGRKRMDDKFNVDKSLSAAEQKFRRDTVGLVSAEEFRKATREAERLRRRERVGLGDDILEEEEGGEGVASSSKKEISEEEKARIEKKDRKAKRKAMKRKKQMMSTLSFAGADDDDFVNTTDENDTAESGSAKNSEGEGTASTTDGAKEIKKDPRVDTSFLPDKDREISIQQQREQLRREWHAKQSQVKNEMLEITYSYWDGSGHRRTSVCRKGDTIGNFLELVRKDLAKEFREMTNVSSDALLYVKEDLIIPQDITFYDLIVTRARGKSGPLFHFDVRDDVRMGALDVRVEKDESHPGKVVERRWYDRNKHIFPASRWEVFDPAKDYGTYTIHGGEVTKKKK